MSMLGVMLHLSMDALNEYGVHPFWPWNNNWYYGDAVFIVEPTYWLAVAPILYGMRTRLARANLWLVLFAGCIAVLAFHRFMLWWWSLPLAAVLLVLAGRRMQPGRAPLLGVALILAITAAFIAARGVANHRAGLLARQQFPDYQTLDVMLSPAPAHPFCWDTMLIQRAGDEYVARQGQLSLLGGSDAGCARQTAGEGGTAPLREVAVPDSGGIHWLGEFSMSRTVLLQVAATNCDTLRVATFLRAPFATSTPEGWMLGDLRYDREPQAGFSETLVRDDAPRRCARDVPWIPPRSDLGLQFLRAANP
jgi:inner membrane protein